MAEKMIIIPAEMWENEKIQNKYRQEPTFQALDTIKKNLEGIMDDPDIPDYDKVKFATYLQLRYKRIFENRPKDTTRVRLIDETGPPNIKPEAGKKNVNEIVDNILKKNPKKLADDLLNFIQKDGSLSWDEKDQLVINGNSIPGTNIINLTQDIVDKKYKSLPPPIGADIFVQHLRQIGTPMKFVDNSYRYNYQDKVTTRAQKNKKVAGSLTQWKERNLMN